MPGKGGEDERKENETVLPCRGNGYGGACGGAGGDTAIYENDWLRVLLQEESIGEGRKRLVCEWKNRTDAALSCQMEIRIRTDFAFSHYVIPGVSLNGNHWGRGKEPKGLLCGGEPWVFDYRRTTIPACTVSENAEEYFALMASDESPLSLRASCSMIPQEDGSMAHRLLYPCIERPKTYCTRDGYAPAHEEFVTIEPKGTVKTECFLLSGKPVFPNFGTAAAEDAALELLGSPFCVRLYGGGDSGAGL